MAGESSSDPIGWRDRYNGFIARHEVGWELAFAFVAIVFVALGFLLR
ncbi:MAG: hypothetical protein ACRDF7_07130 [Candidatus Limnocylindrales bacterium]